jgi:hypothetical protein
VANDPKDLERLLLLDEAELLDDLGRQLVGFGFGAERDEDDRESAKRWLDRNLASLRRVICGNQAVQNLTASDNDTLAEAAAVADLLADLLGWPVGSTVAAIIVKRGLGRLCADYSR